MFLGQIDNYFVPSGEANNVIPIRTKSNTNEKIINRRGIIYFPQNGNFDVDATISVSATAAQNVTVSIYAEDGARASVVATIPAPPDGETVGVANVSLVDAIKVILTKYRNIANIYITVDQSEVTVNGYIRIEYVR
ncbi:MAG: hypothetical protein KBT34_09865 [Prevotella sp.]|nr:hypothetical protein [Candidatus Prevotella equi]